MHGGADTLTTTDHVCSPISGRAKAHGTLVNRPPVPVHARARHAIVTGGDGDPATTRRKGPSDMKPNIHPEYVTTEVTCSCGSTFTTRSTAKGGSIHVETCSACHPFYTGKQRVLDTAGRVAKFQQKYAKVQAKKAK
jgi:large subunit ribosomal protein L31